MALNLAAIAALKARIIAAVADEANDSILVPANEGIPKDTETAEKSGRVVVDRDRVVVTYGLDTDSNPRTGQPSNTYIEVLHENLAAHHENGHAKWLQIAGDEAAAGFAERVARRVRV